MSDAVDRDRGAPASRRGPAPEPDEYRGLLHELTITGQEIARYQAFIAMLRWELRRLRGLPSRAPHPRNMRLRRSLSWRARSGAVRPIRWSAVRVVEHAIAHGQGGMLRSLHPWLVRLLATYGQRWPLRRLFPWLADLSFAGGAARWSPTGRGDLERVRRDVTSLRRDLDHTRALADLLLAEVRLVRTGRLARAPAPTEAPGDLVRAGVLVPTEGMVSRLAGRVRIASLPADAPEHARAGPSERPRATVAVRFHDTRELASLERCLYSLQGQRGVDLQVLIMYQGADQHGIESIETMVTGMWLDGQRPRVVGVPDPEQVDLRARLLNKALDVHYGETSNDFFYVVDHDDVVFSHAAATLAGPILGTDVAVNFGKVLAARYLSFNGYDFLYRMEDFFRSSGRDLVELMVDNFFPIHAYIFHTRAMPPGYLRFDESMDRLEDYECLYRVVSTFPASMRSMDELVGLYCWKGERAIMGPIAGSSDGTTNAWDRNRESLARTMLAVASQPTGDD